MNIRTERLENHTARITVEVDAPRLETAKKQAAQQLSRRVNIPGFRKGKAPYRVLLNYIGEQAIIEDAVELLSGDIYKEVLPDSGLDPYGPGSLENYQLEPLTLSYVLPLQPEVNLGDYRALRLDYTAPEVTDENVNQSLRNLQEQHAVVEESRQPAAPGDRVTMDVHSFFIEEHEGEEAHDHEGEGADEDDAHYHDHRGEPYIHEHDAPIILTEDHEPMPGFSEAIVGANVGDHKDFTLTFPDDAGKYEDAAGRKVEFHVDIKKIETMTLPALTDDFAARVTADEEKQLTLLELRMRVRENLTTMTEERVNSEFAQQVLDALVAQVEIRYPDAMVLDQVEQTLQQLDQDLRRQGLTLNDYMKIYNKSIDDLVADFREPAEQSVKRSLVLREVVRAEGLSISDAQVAEEIDRVVGNFDDARRNDIRRLFDNRDMRESVRNDLLRNVVLARLGEIARGTAPELAAPTQPEAQPEDNPAAAEPQAATEATPNDASEQEQ